MAQSTIHDSGFDVALNILRRRKWAGVIAFVATISLAVPFAMFLPDIYRGVATVIVENQDVSSVLVRASVPEVETRLVTIQQELLSRARLSDLITRLNLYPTVRRRGSMEAVVDRMRRDIHVELSRTDRGRPTTIGLKISYIGLNAKSAAAVPNALATLYVEENTKMRERQTGQMAEFLKSQLDASRNAVEAQESRLNHFKTEHAGQLPEEVSINMVTLERLNTRLRLNTDDQLKVRERQDLLIAGPLASDQPPDALQTLRQKLVELEAKFTEKHPDIIRVKEQIAELEKQRAARPADSSKAATRRADPLASADAEFRALQREERGLRSDIAAYEQRIQSAPQVQQEMEALVRDYNSAKESYLSFQKRYEEAELADSLEQTKQAETFRILDAAIVPAFPAAPNRMRLMMVSFFLAIAAAAGVMLLFEHLDTSFHTVGNLRQFTTLPVLGTIPYVPSKTRFATAFRVVLSIIAVAGMCVLLAGFAYRVARENTQLVWMVSAPQL